MGGRALSYDERVLIESGLRWGWSQAVIAGKLGRDRSVVSRELARNSSHHFGYVAVYAHRHALRRLGRPRLCRLVPDGALRREVLAGLRDRFSPRQISGRLARQFPDQPEMQVSHETIYAAFYLQSRGGLKRELEVHLRTGRTRRRPHVVRTAARASRRSWAVLRIADRPPEVDDRRVPGHWEGDLVFGPRRHSAIATLVERSTRFVLLAALPDGYGADAVNAALTAKMLELPQALRRTLTWDLGNEMARHAQFTIDTGIVCYFCDPHSPWQRGTNENTNGLLREYYPRGVFDFRTTDQAGLDETADQLNRRPRQTLDFMTPSEALNELLVASTT